MPGLSTLCPPLNSDSPSQSIFFVETSGHKCLTARQACSVESAARMNPDLPVRVYQHDRPIAGSKINSHLPGQKRNCDVTEALQREFRNVHLIREDLAVHLEGTPLWKLYAQGKLNESQYPLMHWSDAVRAAILRKYGGIYLDLDCTVLRPLHCLQNTVGLVDYIPHWVENGVMIFDAGHPFLDFLMKYMVFAFKPDEYISLGPATLTDAIKYFCDTEHLLPSLVYQCRHNGTLSLQPHTAFYSIANNRQESFYQSQWDASLLDQLRDSYLSHIYDAGNGRRVHTDSLYAFLSREHCPTTYSMATQQADGF